MKHLYITIIAFSLFACESVQQYGEGKDLYTRHCANCHIDDGSGLEGLIPPLANADLLQQSGAQAACWIRKGLKGKIMVNGREYENEMPPQLKLNEIEITNILNYINNSWGNKRDFISVQEIENVLKGCD